jgi:hypothetical protein
MVKHPLFSCLLVLFGMLLYPLMSRANKHAVTIMPDDGHFLQVILPLPAADTVPGNKPVPENSPAQKKDDLIKEVPKARKQEKPVAVIPVTVKPVVVKPKVIIKPIIKIH